MSETMPLRATSRSLLIAIGIAVFGSGLLSTAAALRLADAQIGEGPAGLVLAGYFAGLVIGSLGLESTIHRVGSVRAFTAFTALSVVAALLHSVVQPSAWWIVLRAMSGVAMAGFYITVEGWLTASAHPENRGRILSIYLVTLYLGLSLGQFVLPLLAEAAIDPITLAALVAGIAATLVALTTTHEPEFGASERMPAREVLRQAPIGWLGAFTAGVVIGTIYTSFPLMLREAGRSADETSLLLGLTLLGGLVGQHPIGVLSDRADRRIVLLGVSVLLAILCVATPAASQEDLTPLAVHALLFGALTFSLYPLSVAHALDRTRSDQGLGVIAQLILIQSIGSTLGPIAASTASDVIGSQGYPLANGLSLVALIGYTVVRIVRIDAVEQEHYVAAPPTSVIVAELDPRTEGEAV